MEKKYISRSWFYITCAAVAISGMFCYTEIELKKLDNKVEEAKVLSAKPATDLKFNSKDLIPKLFIIPGPDQDDSPITIPRINPQRLKAKEHDINITAASIRPTF